MTAHDPHRLSRGAAPVAPSGTAYLSPDAGRSTLLRAGRRMPGRARGYLRRAVVVAALSGLVGALVVAMGTVWFDPDGAARLLYQVHDTVWLPLRGRVWVAPFPGGLVWLVPALGLSALVLVEYLGVAAPLRRVQTAGIALVLRGRAGPVLVLWDGALRRFGLRAGQVRKVATEMRDASRDRVILGIEAGIGAGPIQALLAHEQVVLRLSDGEDADLVSGLQALCLARVVRDQGGAALAETIVAKAGIAAPDWRARADACRNGTLDLTAALAAADGLARGNGTAVTSAVTTLQVALAVVQLGQPVYLVWFDVWARRRASADQTATAGLVQAETMIAFEFWAAQAEARIPRPAAQGLLAEAFATRIGPRIRGEVFARTGFDTRQDGGRA